MTKRAEAPCLGCNNRYIGCHSECIKYKDFRQQLDAELKIFNSYKEGYAYRGDSIRRNRARMAKKGIRK